jgi:hypothetical protein
VDLVPARARPISPRRSWVAALSGLALACGLAACATTPVPHGDSDVRLFPVGEGWARTSVNAVIFRHNSVETFGDTQYLAYYDADGHMVLARRRHGSADWELHRTRYTGNVRDAHNAICIGVDGGGFLHVAWDHHGNRLNYARSTEPGGLELSEPLEMTGSLESAVTYPQFYRLADGDLLFLYRDGSSGQGNVLINRYDLASQQWSAVQHPLIDGEGVRNAYVNQLAIDRRGGWHLSWTWRDTPDVATNHDILYAFSPDEGRSWLTSTGARYSLPITSATAEIVRHVPQGHELINQTSMTVDADGRPLVVTYWRPEGTEVPQFHLVWHDGSDWRTSQVGHRELPFRLSGGGTRRIPVSRPQVLADEHGGVFVVFRDEERGGGISVAISRGPDRAVWRVIDLDAPAVGLWEPSYDPEIWRRERRLHLFHQRVGQGQAETLEDVPPQPVSVLEWIPPSGRR